MTLVTVIVTSYNDGHYLPEAVSSVVEQTHPQVELLVTDDGSTDAPTVRVLDALEADGHTVLRNDHGGLSSNRNHALAVATGAYLVCLDADDRLDPEYLARAAAVLDARPEVSLVAPDMQWFGESTYLERTHFEIGRQLIGNRLPVVTMCRTDQLRQVGGFHPALPHHEDFDAWLGILGLGGSVEVLGFPGLFRRARPGQMSAGLGVHTNPPVLADIARRHPHLYAAHAEEAWRALLTEREMLQHFKRRYGRFENLLHGASRRWRRLRRRR